MACTTDHGDDRGDDGTDTGDAPDAGRTKPDAAADASLDAAAPQLDAGGPDAATTDAGGDALTFAAPLRSSAARIATPSTANVTALGAGNRTLAFELYAQIAKRSPNQNVLLSPYSISTALSMLYAGAAGTTESEMKQTLHFELGAPALFEAFNATSLALTARGMGQVGADGTPFRLNVDNSLWTQRDYPIEAAYLDTLAKHYGAGVQQQDFRVAPEPARKTINEWVSQRTEKLIPELLPQGSITKDTRVVLTNTVYFNASWLTKFKPESTADGPFTKLDGSKVTAALMHGKLRAPYADGSNYKAVALPYASTDLSFVAILPNEGAFPSVEAGLNAVFFDALVTKLASQEVQVTFPKLDYKVKSELNAPLIELGMKAAFSDGADFSGITKDRVAVDGVLHEAVIKVIEGGTIAAAATGITVGTTSIPAEPKTIVLDRPFLLAIHDAPTGSLLFVGRVLDPTAK
jgi:serpin B